jgi:hypothetical protein
MPPLLLAYKPESLFIKKKKETWDKIIITDMEGRMEI